MSFKVAKALWQYETSVSVLLFTRCWKFAYRLFLSDWVYWWKYDRRDKKFVK